MTCRELTDFIIDYLSGDLPPALIRAFDYHLGLCPNCRTYLASYEATVKAGKAAFAGEPETKLPEDLVQAILAATRDAG
jgi:anti-sigma factor RsiW